MKGQQPSSTTRFLAALLLCVSLGAAPPANQEAPVLPGQGSGDVSPAEWPAPYSYIREGSIPGSTVEAVLAALPFEKIELERTACMGPCPVYTVTFHRDGRADYHGGFHAERRGRFSGKVDPFSYGRLCYLLEATGFFGLAADFTAPWTCSSTTYVRVWRQSSSEPAVIRDYGEFGPITLWALQQSIDSVATRIAWNEVP